MVSIDLGTEPPMPRRRHPHDGDLERAIAQFVSDHANANDVFISVPSPTGNGKYRVQVEIADDVVGLTWPTGRVMRYAALLQADRVQAVLESEGLTVHRSRRTFVAALASS
jgi:hypothetical protein